MQALPTCFRNNSEVVSVCVAIGLISCCCSLSTQVLRPTPLTGVLADKNIQASCFLLTSPSVALPNPSTRETSAYIHLGVLVSPSSHGHGHLAILAC